MKSFFSRIKSMLGSDYGGRYIELILREVILEDFSTLRIIFPNLDYLKIKDSKHLQVDVEANYPSKYKSSRRADLVISYKGKHIALLEIKYFDQPLEMQIEDYLQYAAKNNLCFTYLTQYAPDNADLEKITNMRDARYKHLLFADLYRAISKNSPRIKQGSVSKLFCDFMEENFMMYTEKFDKQYENALTLLLIKGLYVKHDAGFKRKVSAENIGTLPDLWTALIGNVTTLGDRFYSDFRSSFNNRFSVDFGFNPLFSITFLEKDIAARDNDDDDYLRRDRKTGGTFFICAKGKIKQEKTNDYLYVAIGYSFELDLKKKSLRKYLYSEIYGNRIESVEKTERLNAYPSEEKCYQKLLLLSERAIEEVLIENPNMSKSRRNSMTALQQSVILKK